MDKVDIAIIGAGVVGLAIANHFSQKYKNYSIIVIEKHSSFGRETSSRNSEVIHAGIYYPKNSLKAQLCLEGNKLLYFILKQKQIPYKSVGKLIVATNYEEELLLNELLQRAKDNGVSDIRLVTKEEAARLEPSIDVLCALHSPATGIFDTHKFMKYLEKEAELHNVLFAYNCLVTGINKRESGYEISIKDADGEIIQLYSEIVINCAGLSSDKIAAMVGIDCNKAGYTLAFSKGEYFKINGLRPNSMKKLVYPVPGTTSLGIHTVLDLQGQIKLGPNAFYVTDINYDVEEEHKKEFYGSVKKFLPFLILESLSPDMAGIRPKLKVKETLFSDFVINHEKEKDFPGLINLIGIESPGLTSCLAIANYVEKML